MSPELRSVLHEDAMREIGRAAEMAESYAASLQLAADRRDEATVRLHLKELVICCRHMAKTYNEHLVERGDGQDAAPGNKPSHDDGQDRRPGDGVA